VLLREVAEQDPDGLARLEAAPDGSVGDRRERRRQLVRRNDPAIRDRHQQIVVDRVQHVDLRAAPRRLAQPVREQRLVFPEERADEQHAIEAPKIRDRHAEPRNPARWPSAEKSDWRSRKSALPPIPCAMRPARNNSSSVECGVARMPTSLAGLLQSRGTASIASRQSTSCQRPSRLTIGAVRRSGEFSASYEKRSRSASQHSLTASFSSGSTRMTRFWITCTTRFAPTPSCGETDLRRPSSQVRAE
jgi:hypothetical protein